MDSRDELRRRLERAVVEERGTVSSAERSEILSGGVGPEWSRALVERIRRWAYKVTDEEIAGLSAKQGDDAVFEVVVAAAGSAARARLEAALKAIEAAR